MNQLSQDVQNRLLQMTNREWDEIYDRVTVFAEIMMRRKGIRGIIKGQDAEDFASQAIEKFYSGQRLWQPEKVSLVDFLFGVVRSDLDACVKSVENTMEKLRIVSDNDDELTRMEKVISFDNAELADVSLNPENALLKEYDSTVLDQFLKFVENDQLVYQIVKLTREGVDKRRDFADNTGKSPEDITNAQKRMKRMMEEFNKQLSKKMR